MLPENCPTSDRNTVRNESERCPTEIGTLSDINWNHCPICVGIRTDHSPPVRTARPEDETSPRLDDQTILVFPTTADENHDSYNFVSR